MVGWEFLGEGLQEVPGCFGGVDGTKSCMVAVLTWVCTKQESCILLGCLSCIVQNFHIARNQIIRDVLKRIVAQAHLHGLIQEQHVHLVVPRVLAEVRGVGVGVDVARSILDEEAQHGRAAGAAVHPDRERSIFWVLVASQLEILSVDGNWEGHTLRASNCIEQTTKLACSP